MREQNFTQGLRFSADDREQGPRRERHEDTMSGHDREHLHHGGMPTHRAPPMGSSGPRGGPVDEGHRGFAGDWGHRGYPPEWTARHGSIERQEWARGSHRRPHAGNSGLGPRNYKRPDERIVEDLYELLSAQRVIDASEIVVTCEHGEVTLTGDIPDRWSKRLAEDFAWIVRGVHDVHNQLRRPRPMTERVRAGGSTESGTAETNITEPGARKSAPR